MVKLKQILIMVTIVVLAMSLFACKEQEPVNKPQPKPIPNAEMTLVAVGDDLIHNTLYNDAADRAGGSGYDFSYMYEHVAPLIGAADVAFINQETPLATDIYPPSNYPLFNTPTEVGDELTKIGFDVVSHANNHMFDQGEKGLLATLDYWDTKEGISVVGAYRNASDLADIRIVDSNGIKLAFIACTEMTNGMSLPSGSEMEYILTSEENLLQEQISTASQLADVVVVAPHWGNEGTHTPNDTQKVLAQKMADWGADIILGSHSHTLQSIEYLEREGDEPAVVIYSLGNFVSGQHGAENMVSGMLRVNLTKDYQNNQKTSISDVKLVPLVTHFDRGVHNVTIYPFSDYTEELAANHGVKKYDSGFSYDYIMNTLTEVIGSEFLSMN